jgi:hypothetical protein
MASPVSPAVSDSSTHPEDGPVGADGAGAAWVRPMEGRAGYPLGKRNVGILCSDPQQPEALLLQRVVSELGARTALVCPKLDADAPLSVEPTAHVLGLLYDGVICVDLPAHSVDRLRESARIPVLADLALPGVVACGQSADDVSELSRQVLSWLTGATV